MEQTRCKLHGLSLNRLRLACRHVLSFGTGTAYFRYNPVMLTLVLMALFAFVLNMPFGYFRSRSEKYSLRWFLLIHLPVPLVIIARAISHTDYKLIPVLILFSVAGQVLGGRIGPN